MAAQRGGCFGARRARRARRAASARTDPASFAALPPMRRVALLALLLGAVAAGAALLLRVRERPRNLILISIDTLRQDRLGAYGYARPTSPPSTPSPPAAWCSRTPRLRARGRCRRTSRS